MNDERSRQIADRLITLPEPARQLVHMQFYPDPETMPGGDEIEQAHTLVQFAEDRGREGQLESTLAYVEQLVRLVHGE